MREMIKDFVSLCAETLIFPEPIHEFGAYQVEGQEHFADLRPIFPHYSYIGSDMRSGPGVDVLLNLHELGLPDNSIGSALLLDTLEHVEYPHRALEEVHRVLKPGGLVIMSSVMKFPIHGFPDDYWRFTPSAFQSLLKPFAWSLVETAGEEDFPHTVVGVGCKDRTGIPDTELREKLQSWKQQWFYMYHQPTALEKTVRLLAPPVLLHLSRKIRGVGIQ